MAAQAASDPTDAEIMAQVAPPSDERWSALSALPQWAGEPWDDDSITELVGLLCALELVPPFDGNAWFSTDRYPNGRGLADASPADAVRLITSYVRSDRFREGALRVALDDGSIAAAIARVRSRRP